MPRPLEIEVFRIGKQTAANGETYTFSAKDIDKAIENHSRSSFRIPIIISHDTKGEDDAKLSEHPELAHGLLTNLRRVGKSVRGTIERGTDQLFDWLKQGRLLDRSMSWYLPGARTSPNPESFFPRHLAFLGRSAPAVKNMSPIAETLGLSETFAAFDEDDPESVIEFQTPGDLQPMSFATEEDVNALKTQMGTIEASLQSTNQKLVEFMDGMKGMMASKSSKKASTEDDKARKTDMSETKPIEDVEALKTQIASLEEENGNLKAKVQELTPKPEPAPTPQEIEYREKTKKLEAAIALQESKALKDEIAGCLTANQEKITPGMKQKTAVSYTERSYDSGTASFNEEAKTHEFELASFMERVASGKTDRGDFEGLKHWLSQLPQAVNLSQKPIVPNGPVFHTPTDPTVPHAGNFSEEGLDRHNKIMAKAKEIANGQKVEPGDASYCEAMDLLISQGVIAGY